METMKQRVFITGVGLISFPGDSPALFHKKLCDGDGGMGRITEFEEQGFASQPGGRVEAFLPEVFLKGKALRPLDRGGRLLASAAKLALESSNWTSPALAVRDVGLVLGTMFGSMHTISQFDRQALGGGPSCASPLDFANTVINSAAGQTAIWHKLRGINSTIATGATSGLMAIGYAADLIRSGRQTAVLAGGTDEFCFETFCGLARAGLLCGPDNAAGAGCPVPFERRRTGIALAEASALLMLENAESARTRGAVILGEVLGHANAYNPKWNQAAHQADGIIRALRGALDDARLSPREVDCISAAANGSVPGDRNEALAIKAVFNGYSEKIPITAIKSMIGETLGAAGALQAIDLLETMRDRVVPGIAHLKDVGPELASLNFCREPESMDARVGLINAVGFDGHACSLLLSGPPQNTSQ